MTIDTKFKVGDEVYYFNDSYFNIEHKEISKIEIIFDGIKSKIKYHFKDSADVIDEYECFSSLDKCTDDIKLNLLSDPNHYSTKSRLRNNI